MESRIIETYAIEKRRVGSITRGNGEEHSFGKLRLVSKGWIRLEQSFGFEDRDCELAKVRNGPIRMQSSKRHLLRNNPLFRTTSQVEHLT